MNKKSQTLIIVVIICILAVGGILTYLLIKPDKPDFICGDKICQSGEDSKNCLKDCPTTSKCGDSICDAKEFANPNLCPKDCPQSVTHEECQNQQCVSVEGTGTDECSQNSDCVTSTAESRFGVHLGSLNYNSAVNHIRELGEQIYVRTEFFGDAIGWKKIKNNQQSIDLCKSCCDPDRSTCNCNVNDMYYCEPENRDSLLETPILSEFYDNDFNLFGNFYNTGGYGDIPPKNIITADYPHGHEDLYRDYVSFLVQNFRDKIKYWQIGNENESPGFWAGTPKEYADMIVIASEEIRQNCADCKVGISFAHPDLATKFPEQEDEWHLVIGDVCDSFDFIDAHFYDPSFIEEGQLDRWKQTCPGKEFISTETGVLDNINLNENKPQNAGGSFEKQAQDSIKYNMLLFAEGYKQIYMYLMDTDYGMGNIPENPFLHNGLIDDVDNSRKPAFTSYKTMIEKVDYFTSITKLADGQYKYTFSNKDPVYVLWCDEAPCTLHSSIPTTNIRITNYQGNSQSEITLTDSPIFVEEA